MNHLVPTDDDLPGDGWMAVDEGFASDHGGHDEIGELFDCVGPDFPDEAVVASAASPHFIHAPRRLLHGFGVVFATEEAADLAESIVSDRPFVECLGRSVAAGIQSGVTDAELLAVDVDESEIGYRVRFTAGDADGVRPVHLDIVALRVGRRVGLLWCGDTPDPFPAADVATVVERIRRRAAG